MSLLARFRLEHARPSNNIEGSTPTSGGDEGDLSDPERLYFPRSSPVGERSGTFHPPSPAQRRRGRSDSAEETLEQESQRKHKRHCAIQVCKDFELAEDALAAFAELDIPAMLITIFGKLLWLERERMRDEVQTFIKSDEFKEVLQDRLRTALLSANISRYLNGINDRIWGFIKKNLTVFNIPPLAMEDARLSIYIDTLMKDVLTKQRSQIKTKIVTSISKNHHISDLAKSLAGRDFVDVTLAQWGRFAFLRQNFMIFNAMVDESLVKKVARLDPQEESPADNDTPELDGDKRAWSNPQFWEFIDELLDEMRAEVRKEPSPELRKKAWEKFFTDSLQLDLERFPAENRSASLHPSDGRSIPEWQKSIHQELAWL